MKHNMWLINICIVMLAAIALIQGRQIRNLESQLIQLEVAQSVERTSAVAVSAELPVTEVPKPPEHTYFDVPMDHDLQDYIFDICEDYDVAPELIVSMIYHESRFHADSVATSDSGCAYGLMQIMPRWHQARMERLGCSDLLDPYQNILVGVDLIAENIRSGRGVEWALMAYNGGSAYADRKASEGLVSDYAASVIDYAKDLCAGAEGL